MAAAVKAAQKLQKRQCCVVLLPDSVRNYMSVYYIVHVHTYVLVDMIDFCLLMLLLVIFYHNIGVCIMIVPNLSMMIGWLIICT